MLRRGFIRSLLMGAAGTAVKPARALAGTDDGGRLTAEIEALLRRTEELWAAQDTAALRSLWDTGDANPYYLAGEQDDWLIGWDQLDAYLAPASGQKITEAIRVRFYDLSARLLAPDLAFAAYWMRTDMKLVFAPKPFGSDNRVAAVLRRKPGGWRYVCYTEAFQAPNLYVQKLFEKDVSPDYQEFYDEVTKR